MAKINKYNKKGKAHGFWKTSEFETHYHNGFEDGFYNGFNYKGYTKNGKIFGFILYENISSFDFLNIYEQSFSKYNKHFGECLNWEHYINKTADYNGTYRRKMDIK